MQRNILTMTALALGVGLGLDLGLATPAPAQEAACAKHAAVVGKLDEVYGERLAGRGIVSPTVIFELYASEKSGTWTILRTDTTGMSCVMITGQVWEQHDPTLDSKVSWRR